jgi:hypothetical protein
MAIFASKDEETLDKTTPKTMATSATDTYDRTMSQTSENEEKVKMYFER